MEPGFIFSTPIDNGWIYIRMDRAYSQLVIQVKYDYKDYIFETNDDALKKMSGTAGFQLSCRDFYKIIQYGMLGLRKVTTKIIPTNDGLLFAIEWVLPIVGSKKFLLPLLTRGASGGL